MTFENAFPGQYGIAFLLDNLDQYQPEAIFQNLRSCPAGDVQAVFNDPNLGAQAVATMQGCIAGMAGGGAAAVDDDTIKQYCNQLIVLVDAVDQANQIAGQHVEQEEQDVDLHQQMQARLDEAENELWNFILQCDLLHGVPVGDDNQPLDEYLHQNFAGGGCNNVASSAAKVILEPLAAHGYQTAPQKIRTYLGGLGINV